MLDGGRALEWEQQMAFYYGTLPRVHLPAVYRDPYGTVIALRLAPA